MWTRRLWWSISILALTAGCAGSPEPEEPEEPAVAEPAKQIAEPYFDHVDQDPPDLCLTGITKWIDGHIVSIPVTCAMFYMETGYPPPDDVLSEGPAAVINEPARATVIEPPEAR
jgi:hypothetical protein